MLHIPVCSTGSKCNVQHLPLLCSKSSVFSTYDSTNSAVITRRYYSHLASVHYKGLSYVGLSPLQYTTFLTLPYGILESLPVPHDSRTSFVHSPPRHYSEGWCNPPARLWKSVPHLKFSAAAPMVIGSEHLV